MQDALQRQADQIAMEVERTMDEVLDEAPPRVEAPVEGVQSVDEETLAYVRLCVEEIRDLLWYLGRPGAVSDLTLMTRLEDATGFAEEVLKVWASGEDAVHGEAEALRFVAGLVSAWPKATFHAFTAADGSPRPARLRHAFACRCRQAELLGSWPSATKACFHRGSGMMHAVDGTDVFDGPSWHTFSEAFWKPSPSRPQNRPVTSGKWMRPRKSSPAKRGPVPWPASDPGAHRPASDLASIGPLRGRYVGPSFEWRLMTRTRALDEAQKVLYTERREAPDGSMFGGKGFRSTWQEGIVAAATLVRKPDAPLDARPGADTTVTSAPDDP